MLKIILFLFIVSTTFSQIKIKAVGDMMLGSLTPRTILPPENGEEFVESIGSYLNNADIVFGNLEGAIIEEAISPTKCSEESRNAGRCYEFGMPEYLAPSLKKMGFNVLNLDNNHSEDYGSIGYQFTQSKLEKLGIKFAPKMGNAELIVDGKKVVVAAFGYSGNSYNISDLETAREVVSELDKINNIIIVSFHGGAEGKSKTHVYDETEMFLGENRGNVFAFARAVIDAGADMVIGHGPHVLRTIDVYKGKLIAYSLGNFLTYGNMSISGVSGLTAILRAELDENTGDILFGKIIPVRQIGRGIPVYDDEKAAIELIKCLKVSDFPERELVITSGGYFYIPKPLYPEHRKIEAKKIDLSVDVSKVAEVEIPEFNFIMEDD